MIARQTVRYGRARTRRFHGRVVRTPSIPVRYTDSNAWIPAPLSLRAGVYVK